MYGQTAIILKDLSSKEYPAIAQVNRKRRVNGQREITISFVYAEINEDFISKIEFGWKILFDGEWYTITNPGYAADGDYISVGITAVLSFFVDLNGFYMQDKAEDKSFTPGTYFETLFQGTGYNFFLVSNLLSNTFSYQDNQSKTERFLYGIDRFNCEYIVRGNNVYIYDQIGSDKDVMLHEDLNIKNVSVNVDASGFHTWAKGYGDLPESDGVEEPEYQLEVEYESPLIAKYGRIEGPAIKDGNYKDSESLTAAVRNQVENSYNVSTEIDAVDLTNNGYPEYVLDEGDRVWLYVSKLNLNQQVRVMEVDETFDWEGNRVDVKYVLGNEGIASRYKTQQYDTLKDFQDILNGKKKIQTDWLPDAILRASDIINGNQDSLFRYLPGEIIGINQNDPNGYMRFNTDGIGFSRDGGKTYRTAITYEGINADYIVAGTLRGILIEGVEIHGSKIVSQSNPNRYTKIENSFLEARGTYTRTWRGPTTTHDVKTRLQNGHLRFRNESLDRSLYLSEFGISTYVDGEGEGAGSSGSIIWWDKTYSPSNANGLTINSYGGVVALESDLNRIVLNANQSVNLESATSPIIFRPYRDNRGGSNVFMMTVAESSNSSQTHGYLMYGSEDNRSVGLRFHKGSSAKTIEVVNGDYASGGSTIFDAGILQANSIRKRDGSGSVYWNGSGTGTTSGTDLTNTLFASGIRARVGDSNLFLATNSGGSVHVTNFAGYNGGNGISYRPIVAQEFTPSSSVRYKDNIHLFEESGMDIVRDTHVYTFYFKSDLEEGIYDNQQIGFLAEASPMLRKGDTVSHNKAISVNWKATQELINCVKELEKRIIDLEMAV